MRRRDAIKLAVLAAITALLVPAADRSVAADRANVVPGPATQRRPAKKPAKAVRVVVWDEQQPSQKPTYEDFLGNHIAAHLSQRPGLTVKSVRLADPDQGIGDDVLDRCDVLVWWGHVQQFRITPEQGRQIVRRIKAGKLSLIALHSSHWATPFVEAMYDRTRTDVRRAHPALAQDETRLEFVPPPKRYHAPEKDAPLTPRLTEKERPFQTTALRVHLPNCCFPAYRAQGGPSTVTVVKPDHPIARGVPAEFAIPQTEMYAEPFHVPPPDEVILKERWPTGEWFRAGCVWKIGKGRVFYFRPGHETYPIFKQQAPLKIIENAIRWLAGQLP